MKRKLNEDRIQQMDRIGKVTTIKKGLDCIKGTLRYIHYSLIMKSLVYESYISI